MKTITVIPCYNEEKTIGHVVRRAVKQTDAVVVADGQSADRTVKLAQSAGAIAVINHSDRQGVGRATALGMRMALEMGADIIVTLDGDGQHDADEIGKVLKPIVEGEADLVIGMRMMRLIRGDGVPRYRQIGIEALTWLYNVGSGRKVADGQSGFRAYSRRLLEAAPIEEISFGFSTEILVKARALGFRIAEVPVGVVYHREFSQNSTMNPITHGLRVVWATLKWRVRMEFLNGGNRNV